MVDSMEIPTSPNRERFDENEEKLESAKNQLSEAAESGDMDKTIELAGQTKELQNQRNQFIEQDKSEAYVEDAERAEKKDNDFDEAHVMNDELDGARKRIAEITGKPEDKVATQGEKAKEKTLRERIINPELADFTKLEIREERKEIFEEAYGRPVEFEYVFSGKDNLQLQIMDSELKNKGDYRNSILGIVPIQKKTTRADVLNGITMIHIAINGYRNASEAIKNIS